MDHKTNTIHTSQQILDIAQGLVQTRGYNGFSYGDIAQALNVSKASLHYHFPSKAILGTKLIERYGEEFKLALDKIDRPGGGSLAKLRRFVGIYTGVLAGERVCLCGMLTAEFMTLPPAMQAALNRFFEQTEKWIVAVLEAGRTEGSLHFTGAASDAAQYFIGSLEGSMIMARAQGGMTRFNAATAHLLAQFGTAAATFER
jgi:TetR/AcrR family transcriptional repressor of nem operon